MKNDKWEQQEVCNRNSYIGKHSGYALPIFRKNEILIFGGFSFCQSHRSMNAQLYNTVTNQITDFGDILPTGACKDGRTSKNNYIQIGLFILF